MSYSASKIECLRFAGRQPAEGIGCCAIDEFQGFINDPDSPASVLLKHGDSGTSLMVGGSKKAYLGETNREIFQSYLRIGTFSLTETPNRIFLASLTKSQCHSEIGRKWLTILKENGFEFIRATDNSVYSGRDVSRQKSRESTNVVYLFGLFRNIGSTRLEDPTKPPKFWDELPPSKDPFTLWEEGKLNVLAKEEEGGPKTASPFSGFTPVAVDPDDDGEADEEEDCGDPDCDVCHP